MDSQPEPWLRGPLPGIAPLLQPPAHAFVMAREDVEAQVSGLTAEQLWARPGGAASVGFHLAHLSGSTDRLLTYARGDALSHTQRAALDAERELAVARPALGSLLDSWRATVANALQQIAGTPESALLDVRFVGRGRIPSTVIGLTFHAAEHAQRHVGQIIVTAKVVRAGLAT
jgi:DinB superfamily